MIRTYEELTSAEQKKIRAALTKITKAVLAYERITGAQLEDLIVDRILEITEFQQEEEKIKNEPLKY